MYIKLRKNRTNEGQSLIEILFAMSLGVLAVSTLSYMVFNTQTNTRALTEKGEAKIYALEGIDSVKSLAQSSFNNILPGTYGLSLNNGLWEFSGTSDSLGKYTRVLQLVEVDPFIYRVTSTVTWNITSSRSASTTYTTFVSNWEQTVGDAEDLVVDVSSVIYELTGTSIEGLTLENIDTSSNSVLTQMKMEWDGAQTLYSVEVDTVLVYNASTSGPIASGEIFDIDDVTLVKEGTLVNLNSLLFTDDMQNTELLISLYFSDSSTYFARVMP